MAPIRWLKGLLTPAFLMRSQGAGLWKVRTHDSSFRPVDVAIRNVSSTVGNRSRKYRNTFRLTATWLMPNPNGVRYTDLLGRLPRLAFPFQRRLTESIFLATPGLAGWFGEGETLLSDAMNHIYADFPRDPYGRKIRSFVAVVDRLPYPSLNGEISTTAQAASQEQFKNGSEGLSLLVQSVVCTPVKGAIVDISGSVRPRISFEYSKMAHRLGSETTRLELCPANTLFTNGTPFTMFQQLWQKSLEGDSKLKQVGKREPLLNYAIHLPQHAPTVDISIETLTAPRTVASSMGNVLRQLVSPGTGEHMSASSELEKRVPEYLETKTDKAGQLKVFALITPGRENRSLDPGLPLLESREEYSETETIMNALSRGGHLHRVISGGGGWGKKQGLLSLDPAFDFGALHDTEGLSMIKAPDERLDTVEQIMKPGDEVQFFACFQKDDGFDSVWSASASGSSLPSPDIDTSSWAAMDWIKEGTQSIVLGTIPPKDTYINQASTVNVVAPKLTGIPNHFGMLSEGGACLRKERDGAAGEVPIVASVSRLDFPSATFSTAIQNRPARYQSPSTHKGKENEAGIAQMRNPIT